MAQDGFRAALASGVKFQDQVSHTIARICISAMGMCNSLVGISMQEFFLGKNLVLTEHTTKILLSGRILTRILEIFLLSRFLSGILAKIHRRIFPRKDPAGKTDHLAMIPARSWHVIEIKFAVVHYQVSLIKVAPYSIDSINSIYTCGMMKN